jgi:hypothetical protein
VPRAAFPPHHIPTMYMEALMKKYQLFILFAAVLITAFEVFSLTA